MLSTPFSNQRLKLLYYFGKSKFPPKKGRKGEKLKLSAVAFRLHLLHVNRL